jgi:hypothetical protein
VTRDEQHRVPWYGLTLAQQHLDHRLRGLQIRVVELVTNVPTKRPEFLTLLDNGMEVAQTKSKLMENLRLNT